MKRRPYTLRPLKTEALDYMLADMGAPTASTEANSNIINTNNIVII